MSKTGLLELGLADVGFEDGSVGRSRHDRLTASGARARGVLDSTRIAPGTRKACRATQGGNGFEVGPAALHIKCPQDLGRLRREYNSDGVSISGGLRDVDNRIAGGKYGGADSRQLTRIAATITALDDRGAARALLVSRTAESVAATASSAR
jgi:hypothetical protein